MKKRKTKRIRLTGPAWGEADANTARGVCESVMKCAPWAARQRGGISAATCGWCVAAAVAMLLILAVVGGVKS